MALLGIGAGFFITYQATAQSPSPDEYFQQARTAAFDQKNYPAAIRLCQQALKKSPDYLDIKIFLGRLYYWNNQGDSSLVVLQEALLASPAFEDAAQALADVSYYGKDYSQALTYSAQGLKYHPASQSLTIRKVRSLAALSQNQEAYALTDSLLKTDPDNSQLRLLASQLREFSYRNKLGLSYDYTWFDKQFSDPWHLTSIDYSRQTKAGSFTGRVSYANHYAKSGVLLEADAYPRISKTIYAYTSIGYSPDLPAFPTFRAGFSLYATVFSSWEAEGGFRYLYFDNNTWIYTFSVGKYYRNFWFNGRTYISPGNNIVSRSYILTTRYYLKGAENYFTFLAGRGISPDERSQAIRFNSDYQLQTSRVGAGYRFAYEKRHIISLLATFENGYYMPETKGSQFNVSAGYQLRF